MVRWGVVPASLSEHVSHLMTDLASVAARHYGDRLVSVVVFGSMGRGTPRHESDLGVLIVADDLPRGRMARVEDFAPI
jgi:predicted nucleotidyltransferase